MALGQREDGSLIVRFGDGDVLICEGHIPGRAAPLAIAPDLASDPLGTAIPPEVAAEATQAHPPLLMIFPTAKSVDGIMDILTKVKRGLEEAEAAGVATETTAQTTRGET